MALAVLNNGAWELRWPTTFTEWNSFLSTWGTTPETAVAALALGHYSRDILQLRIWIISGFRSFEEQRELRVAWEAGRRRFPANRPGESRHNFGTAFDIGTDYRLRDSQWRDLGFLAGRLGLKWGGDPSPGKIRDEPHFQLA